jgi:hypothetical protein
VREVAAVREAEAHHGVAGLAEGEVHREVGGRAGVGLHVGVLDAEEGLDAVAGELLDGVDELLALVVALAGVALAVLVVERRAAGLEDGAGGVVLAGDHAELVALALVLVSDEVGDVGVALGERRFASGVHGGGVRSLGLLSARGEEFVAPFARRALRRGTGFLVRAGEAQWLRGHC